MERDIRHVAVIGAGISGVLTALHLISVGIQVTVYERSSEAGGVWLYDQRRPPEPEYPSIKALKAGIANYHSYNDDAGSGELSKEILNELLHAPPGPCYEGLSNNVSTPLLAVKKHPWKPGTPDFVGHRVILEYIQGIASSKSLLDAIQFRTRVDLVTKKSGIWTVKTSALTPGEPAEGGSFEIRHASEDFDAVVVASGHYHACKVPDIPGLADWKRRWPHRIQHSKSYRDANDYRDMNVLLIGAGVSSIDIARELGPVAKGIYQSSRGGAYDLPADMLPEEAIRVRGIRSFKINSQDNEKVDSPMTETFEGALAGTVHLADGTTLHDIHQIIVCTGYHCSYPFLPELHQDDLSPQEADKRVLVTDGTQMHNLYKDIFYIPDPTLAFIGVPFYTATFTLFEFQALALAAVYSRRADLPSEAIMRMEYTKRVREKGFGRGFHNYRDEEIAYVNSLVAWVNERNEETGLAQVTGHSAQWHAANVARMEKIKARAALKEKESKAARTRSVW
ncbi:hypothetical protein MMC25_001844 [Agyrium rufum]|nr:hypothetical protein [Agyrium rufum]